VTEHVHENFGSPYDFSLPVTCPACVEILWEKRDKLCEKYGWDKWPDALNQGRDHLDTR
jgi:hypothetical protein